MTTNQHDADLIVRLGGPSKVAELIGFKKQGGAQRVQNWLTRGIPSSVKIKFPSIFLPELAAAPADSAQAATENVAQPTPLRAGVIRRHNVRRETDLPADLGRRENLPSPVLGTTTN